LALLENIFARLLNWVSYKSVRELLLRPVIASIQRKISTDKKTWHKSNLSKHKLYLTYPRLPDTVPGGIFLNYLSRKVNARA
jgi:hypothetical protein